jgi:hypothetical protein
MTDRSDLDAALKRVVDAARAHLAAVRAAGGRAEDDGVWQSYVELNNASFHYDELLLDEFGEVTPWDVEPIDPAEADEQWAGPVPEPAAADDQSLTISVRQRRDYTVPSTAALLRAAEGARKSMSRPGGEPEAPIGTVGAAVAELMQAGDGALGALDVPELEPLGGVVAVSEVRRPLGLAELDDEDDNAAFVIDDDGATLYRFDEHVEAEPDDEGEPDEAGPDGGGGNNGHR